MDKVTRPLGKINLMQYTNFFTFHECKKVAKRIDLTRFLAGTDVSRILEIIQKVVNISTISLSEPLARIKKHINFRSTALI